MSDFADRLELAQSVQNEGGEAGSALDIYEMVRRQQEAVAAALPDGMDPTRFIRMVLTEMRRTPKLAICDPATVLGAMMLSAQTGLEPGGPLGQSFLIPRWSKARQANECQFQIGYKGYVQLAARCGVTVEARTVRDGDFFQWQYGTNGFLNHKPELDADAPALAWWAMGHYPDDRYPAFVVIGRRDADRAKNVSAAKTGPWITNYDAMAQKTAVLRLAPFLQLTTDVAMAMAADGAVVAGPKVSVEEAAEVVEAEHGEPDEDEPTEPEGAPDAG